MAGKFNFNAFTKSDFTGIDEAFQYLIDHHGSVGSELSLIKNTLNTMMDKCNGECVCREVIYTNNTDKLFFGMAVYPHVNDMSYIVRNSTERNPLKFVEAIKTQYTIEIDSKLCDKVLGFTGRHLTAILLHEIGHIVLAQKESLYQFIDLINHYCAKNHTTLKHDIITYNIGNMFKYPYYDMLRKTRSFFGVSIEEIDADTFASACGYHSYLMDAYRRISKNGFNINKNVKNKLYVLDWVMKTYSEMGVLRMDVIRKLKKSGDITGSVTEKQIVSGICTILDSPDDNSIQEDAEYLMSEGYSFLDKVRRNGLKGIKNDLYELRIRVKSSSDEEECLYLLRMINSRIGILDDYIAAHIEDSSDKELEEWVDTLHEYEDLRETLTTKQSIKKVRYYGLYTDYSKLPPEYLANPMY